MPVYLAMALFALSYPYFCDTSLTIVPARAPGEAAIPTLEPATSAAHDPHP